MLPLHWFSHWRLYEGFEIDSSCSYFLLVSNLGYFFSIFHFSRPVSFQGGQDQGLPALPGNYTDCFYFWYITILALWQLYFFWNLFVHFNFWSNHFQQQFKLYCQFSSHPHHHKQQTRRTGFFHFCLWSLIGFFHLLFSDRIFSFLSLVIDTHPLFLFQGWMGSGYNLDPAKIGQEGYNLLKYYEQQLKALQVQSRSTICSVMILRLNVG